MKRSQRSRGPFEGALPFVILTVCGLSSWTGCAPILGFEEFEEGEAAGNGDGDGDGDDPNGTCEGDECPEPVCEEGASRCAGGETELEAQTCNTGRSAFEATDLCDVADLQCNPTTASCFELHVDETEVTRKEYEQFVAAAVDLTTQPKACEFNLSFEPDEDCMADERVCQGECDDHPQVCVDFCDAVAYCAFRGQRLCGSLSGGALVDFEDEFADPGASEWMNACSSGGQYRYAPGDEAPETDADACTYDGRLNTTYPVGSRDGCYSKGRGYLEYADLSGNVAEWENNCESALSEAGDEDVACHVRGGSFESPLEEIECAQVPSIPVRRAETAPTIGFRCCSD